MDLYHKEKQGLIDHDASAKIFKNHHLALIRAGNIKIEIPSMYVLVVKNDKDGKPLCPKSRIVVLGNFEDSLYQNPNATL